MKFFFTYGTDPEFPYQGGWTEISADNFMTALRVFQLFHPNRSGSTAYNFAFAYNETNWKNTRMFKENNCYGHARREFIMVTSCVSEIEHIEGTVGFIESITSLRTVIDDS